MGRYKAPDNIQENRGQIISKWSNIYVILCSSLCFLSRPRQYITYPMLFLNLNFIPRGRVYVIFSWNCASLYAFVNRGLCWKSAGWLPRAGLKWWWGFWNLPFRISSFCGSAAMEKRPAWRDHTKDRKLQEALMHWPSVFSDFPTQEANTEEGHWCVYS